MPPLSRAVRTARAVRSALSRPPYAEPGTFYSPLTSPADTARALADAEHAGPLIPGIDLAEARQLDLLAAIGKYLDEPLPGPRYQAGNSQYGAADAAVYRGMLHYLRPSRVIEVGSGFSTALLLDEADHDLPRPALTCIEPYPDRLLGLLRGADRERLALHAKPVQDIPLASYGQLSAGDVLFVDSTHVVKAGSDVNWLLLTVLPRLAPGVVVHVHDVFWPFEYPARWLAEHRDWTEDYLLRAFLTSNADWEILLFSSWAWHCHPELIPPWLAAQEPGSIWLRRHAR
jgi:predicted O-methyltransferase YrrM